MPEHDAWGGTRAFDQAVTKRARVDSVHVRFSYAVIQFQASLQVQVQPTRANSNEQRLFTNCLMGLFLFACTLRVCFVIDL